MAKSSNKATVPGPPIVPRVGDKVTIPRAKSVLEITRVSDGGQEVDLHLPGTNLEWFRIKSDTLTYVERKPPAKTSNPFTKPEPVIDTAEVMERIELVRRENLERIDDDVDTLKSYLKTQGVPKAVIEALEGMTVEQHVSWKKVVERIEKLLGEMD
jgi:hypothetical protein